MTSRLHRLRPGRALAVVLSLLLLFRFTEVGLPAQTTAPSFDCGFVTNPIVIKPVMPLDFYQSDAQAGADCTAWQEFIYLNWPVDPKNPGEPDMSVGPSGFGNPNDYTAVWESYPEASSLFTEGATLGTTLAQARDQPKRLSATSKFEDLMLDLSAFGQAGNNAWLTDQSTGLTFYEVRVNKDEAQFITENGLSTASGQLACTQGKNGFNLPAGQGSLDCKGQSSTYGDNMGAIELKAAWIELTDPSTYPNYFIAQAEIYPPGESPHQGTVGLVGLHIIHKVPSAQQFIWATFEHVQNAPDQAHANPSPTPYTFYNPMCDPSTDYYKCGVNHQPTPTDPYTAPVQVVRTTEIGTQVAAPLNTYVWSQLSPDSVFLNYQLVDVIWPQANTMIPPNATAPLTCGDSISEDQGQGTSSGQCPTAGLLANTTMETYFQGQLNCLDCHTGATIASSNPPRQVVRGAVNRPSRVVQLAAAPTATPMPASDYSFIFSADTPGP